MARAESTINTFDLILQQRMLLGSVANTKDYLVAIYTLPGSGQVTLVVTVIEFDDIPQGLDDLRHHRVTGRVVAHVADCRRSRGQQCGRTPVTCPSRSDRPQESTPGEVAPVSSAAGPGRPPALRPRWKRDPGNLNPASWNRADHGRRTIRHHPA
jgi:hypothetical protein